MTDPKNGWISELVPGKSFIDVGGLWGTVNEKVSVALKAGAAKATMSDINPLGNFLWQDFDRHCQALGVEGYDSISFDLTRPEPERATGIHDVVHCSGIIYHVPDPWGMIANLRRIARSHVILTSMVLPDTVENARGQLRLHRDNALFIPSLREDVKAIVAEHFDRHGLKIFAINAPADEPWTWDDGSPNFGPWWWLLNPALLGELAKSAGFEILDEGWSWEGLSYSLLLKKI